MIGIDAEALGELIEQRVRKVLEERESKRIEPGPEFVTIAAAADLVGYGVTTIRGWMNAGKVKRYGKGRAVRLNRVEVISYAKSLRAESKRPSHEDSKAFADAVLGKRAH